MNDIATMFCLRRDMETGKLALDAYMQVDYAALKLEQIKAQAVAALEGTDKFHDPLKHASNAASMMSVRAKCDGAIVGCYGFKGDELMTRDEFWKKHKGWPLKKFKEFRV